MNQDPFNQFWLEYERHFAACLRAHPQRYGHTVEDAPLVARKVRERFVSEGIDSLSLESESLRLTCQSLGIGHSREAIESFLSPGTASLPHLNTEASPISPADAEPWARDWFAGSAYCPRCANDYTIFVNRVSTDAESRIETWHCHRCTHSWKIEFRESAATADSDAEPSDWVERFETPSPESISQALDAAITRLSNAAYACGEWSSVSEQRYDDVYGEGVLARQALEAVCVRICRGDTETRGIEEPAPLEESSETEFA